MGKSIKIQAHSGYSVSCDIQDDKGDMIGEFVFICSKCHFEYFKFSEDAKKLYCGKCNVNIGYKLEGKWKRPRDTPGRKCLGFYMDVGTEYVWTCHCGYNLHHLMHELTHTECEKCQGKTSRCKDIITMTDISKVKWNI